MDSITAGQKCAICGIIIPVGQICVDSVFEEARCEPCVERWGPLPIASLRAAVSAAGLDWEKISPARRDELLKLQTVWWDFNQGVDKDTRDVRHSILPVFRDVRIFHIKDAADKKRKEMQQEIKRLIEIIKTEMKKEEVQ